MLGVDLESLADGLERGLGGVDGGVDPRQVEVVVGLVELELGRLLAHLYAVTIATLEPGQATTEVGRPISCKLGKNSPNT